MMMMGSVVPACWKIADSAYDDIIEPLSDAEFWICLGQRKQGFS